MINGLKITQIPIVKFQLEAHHKKLQSISGKKFPFVVQQIHQEKQYDHYLKESQTKSLSQKNSFSLSSSRNNFFTGMTSSQRFRLKKTKQNHLKSVSYHKVKKELSIQHENQIIYQKLLSIKKRKDVNNLGASIGIIIPKQGQNKSIQKIKSIQQIEGSGIKKHEKKMAKDFVYRKKQMLAIQSTNAQIGKRIMNQTGYYDHQKHMSEFNKTRQIINRLGKFNTVQRLMKSAKRLKTLPNKLPKLKTEFNQQI